MSIRFRCVSPGRSTLTASAEVREKARIALLGLGYTQQVLADFLELSLQKEELGFLVL
ncbi:hypothetical protein [Dolichospermum sp. UHCC 0352]|uniref:hypothetical protein n=1 Tax=Dolichospermum sp. UHCC 0352 TaxID=2590011 RepID=UPI001447A8C9|nr:hypothetical protein [Dolichospermum sp. UHCC 0352]